MQTLFNTAASVEVLIGEAHTAFKAFELDFAEQRRRVLTSGYAIAHACHVDPAKNDELIQALITRQIPPANEGENSFLPIIRAVAGEFDAPNAKKVSFFGFDDLTPFKLNKSWDKYAAVWRFAYKEGISPDQFHQWLVDAKGGLNAIINADRKKYGNGPRTKRPKLSDAQIQALVEQARTMPGVSIAAPTGSKKGTFALARVYIEDGLCHFHGIVKASEAAALNAEIEEVAAVSPAQSPEFIAARERQAQAMAATTAQQANGVTA